MPPFDLDDYPTPLASFRKTVRDQKDATLFTVSGLQEGMRVRLATMDAYDGTVYNVSGGGGGSGSFARVGSTIAGEHEGSSATLRFTAADLGGVWLPDAGHPSSVEFAGPRADALSGSLHYNDETQVAVVTSRLAAGDSYTLTTTLPPVPSDEEARRRRRGSRHRPGSGRRAGGAVRRDAHRGRRGDDRARPGAGDRDHALDAGVLQPRPRGRGPSRPGHGSERLQLLLSAEEGMVGDDEQYATAMALMVDEPDSPPAW